MTRVVRYMVPNVITLSSMVFGLVSLYASHTGNTPLAAWMIIYAVLTDRMDGLVARSLHATSELGMQLDSFADMLNFGIAPTYMILIFLPTHVAYYREGFGEFLLFATCAWWMLCAVFRLARYNIQSDDKVPTKIFFGFPTTLAGGLLAIWMLVFLKYTPGADFGGAKLLGNLETPEGVWRYLPIPMALLAYLMASRLPMPKAAMTKNKAFSIFLFICLSAGYVCGFAMHYPELLFWMPTSWALVFLVWGQVSASARAMYPPPLFPRITGGGDDKSRPQEDLTDIVLDDAGQPAQPAPKP